MARPASRRASRSAGSSSLSSGGSKPAAPEPLGQRERSGRQRGDGACGAAPPACGLAGDSGRSGVRALPSASRSSRPSSVAAWAVLAWRGRSSTRPPPSVSGGAIWRITRRSPACGQSGRSSRSCQYRPPSHAIRAAVSRVPWCTCTRTPVSGSRPSNSSSASTSRSARSPRRGAASTSPLATSSTATPVRLTATRWPAARDRRGVVHLYPSHARPAPRGQHTSSSPRPIRRTTASRSRPCPHRGS